MTFLALLALSLLGLASHWLKKYYRGQSKASFKDYMLHYKKRTIASVFTVISAVIALYSTLDAVELTGQLASLAFLAGYAGDSAVNKGPGE